LQLDYVAEMPSRVTQREELGVPMWECEAARLVFKHAMHKGQPRRT
jgi:hypothetical protein